MLSPIRRTYPFVFALALATACHDPPQAPKSLSASVEQAVASQIAGSTIPFDDLRIFFEFNATDNDLGVQLNLDADDWERVVGFDPGHRQIFQIMGQGRLRELGLTELFFESAEPSPAEVLALFPAGTYEFTGRTVDGEALLGTAQLSHNLPPAPSFITPSPGQVVDRNNLVIQWQPLAGLAGFQLIVANEVSGETMTVDLKPSVTSFPVPAAFLQPNTLHKAEVLSIGTNGNKTISELTFTTGI